MASAENDVKAKDSRPERSASPAPAPAVAPAATAKVAAVRRKKSPPLRGPFCYFLVALFLGTLTLGFLALAESDMWPGSLIRPYFWGPSPALTKADWGDKTAGRTVFLKFYSPWCRHCMELAPAWDELTTEYANHSFLRVGEVNCARKGKSLCQELGISIYPSLKYGDPNNLQDYTGGRTVDDISKFASELGPTCSPFQLQVCSDVEKTMIEEYQAMGAEKRQAKILEQESELRKIEAAFKTFAEGLSNEYKEATLKKEEAVKAVQDGGLAMLKAVSTDKAAPKKSEDPKKDEEAEKAEL